MNSTNNEPIVSGEENVYILVRNEMQKTISLIRP